MAEAGSEKPQLIIVDTDAGVDDAQALLMVLADAPRSKLLAVTCVAGNCGLDDVCRNVQRTMDVAGATDVPLYRGVAAPLVTEVRDASYFHGKDGLGDAGFEPIADEELRFEEEHAALALIRLSKEYEGEVTLLVLGPCTNVALAQRLDPGFAERLSRTVVMGGTSQGTGNTSPTAEFNFLADPEAAYIVCRDFKRVELVTWELTLRCELSWKWMDALLLCDSERARFVVAITAFCRRFCEDLRGGWVPCDPLAAAIALYPECITEADTVCMSVELAGSRTRGQSFRDHVLGEVDDGRERNVKLVTAVDMDIFKRCFAAGCGGVVPDEAALAAVLAGDEDVKVHVDADKADA